MERKEDEGKRHDKERKKEENTSKEEDKKVKDITSDGSKDEPSLADTTEKSDDYRDDDSIRNIFSEFIDDRGGCSKYLLDEPKEEIIKVFGEEYKIKINSINGNGFGSHSRKEGNGDEKDDKVNKKRDRTDKGDEFDQLFGETENKSLKKDEDQMKIVENTGTKQDKEQKHEKTIIATIPSKSANVDASDRSRSREKKVGEAGRSKSMGRNAGAAKKNKSRERVIGVAGRSKSRERNVRSISRSKSRDRSKDLGKDEKEEQPLEPDPGHEPEDIIVTFGKGESQGFFIAHAVDNARGFAKGAGKSDTKDQNKSATKPVEKLKVKELPTRRAKSIEKSPMRNRPPIKYTKKPKEISRIRKETPEKPKEAAKVEQKEVATESESIPQKPEHSETPVEKDGANGGGGAAKPSSAGATREASMRVLQLCQKGEWPPMDQVLKGLEKTVAAGGDDVNPTPLAGIMDPVTGMTPLMFAVKENRTSFVDRMIELGCDITARNNDNFNALHIASMFSREDVVKVLLNKKGIDVYAPGGARQQTAVHLVASRQTGTATSILRVLLAAAGKEIRMRADASEGQTALHIASAEGDETLVKYFYGVRASASIIDNQDRTPMHLAAENGHASIIELLADKFKASIFERTKDGSTLMHIASLNGHADCAMMLFKKGVYLHMPNKNGARSIHTAARYGHVGIINTLLQKGEKVDVTTSDNYTPLHIAVESCKPAVVETLLGYGADVHIRGGKTKETPLHIASRVKDGEKCGLMLLKSGAGPNLTTEDGQTPVHVSASNGNLATLLLLLEDGGDPMFKSKKGETPLHLACANCHADVVKHLLDFVRTNNDTETSTAFVNTVNEDGATAVHYAGQVTKAEIAHRENPMEDKEVVRLLLEAGGDVNIQTHKMMESAFHYIAVTGNNDTLLEMLAHMSSTETQKALNRQNVMGWTPLLIACHHGHTDMVNTLLANHARVDVFDNEGRSALHLAAEQGYQQVCDALLTNKAFINSKSRVGRTALHLAAMKGFSNLCKFLIQDHNAMIDVLTLRKQTPLHLAAAAGQLEVCRLLLELGASIDATDDQGQKPIHVAAQNNFPEVAQLFLQQHPSLVMASTKDGNTCAHIAAMQGSVRVIEELMKFDRTGVISARNRVTEATPLQLAAEGGHADVVKVLVRAGASCTDENKAGFTAVHLAAQNGHGQVLEVMKSSQSLRVSSKKLGVTALHVAAYFGQADTVRELLASVPATVKSDPPTGASLVGELGNESGMTPLHFAAYSGNENVVRLLLNSVGVQVDAATTENGYNPLHLACFGGHITVVGLLLSRSSDLLHSSDKHGKTGLHVAATHGHYQMVEVLLGQGAEINATDKNGWTALHCAARAGCFDVVRLLVESGASPKSETNYGSAPIWFAASEGHNDVLEYLLTKEHDTYNLMEDRRFVYNLMICSKKHNDKPMQEFILVSPAPVDTAAKLSAIYITLSSKEKERAKDLISAGQFCEGMATELLALAAGADSAGRILTATDRRNMEFLDVLIENEQKEVIAHTVVQRYLQELWQGSLGWASWKTMLLFCSFILCPPVWIYFTLSLGHKFHKIPIIKFMSYLTSHIHLMILLMLVGITPFKLVVRSHLNPYWYEWALLVWLSGLLLSELTSPSDKSGLGWIKLTVLLFGIFGVALHLVGYLIERLYWPTLMYLRNQLFALSFLLACVQILDFLSFHYLFGPWAIIIGNLMKDLARFLAVLAIFIFGFAMHIVALNQPFKNQTPEELRAGLHNHKYVPDTYGYFSEVRLNPMSALEFLFFAVFGQTTPDNLKTKDTTQPEWTLYLFKFVFGIYMLVSVVVLINLLIAMMSDTYQRIQAQSDIEWKYGLAKLIRNMHRTTTTPSPINLITTWLMYLLRICKRRMMQRKRPSLVQMMGLQSRSRVSARSKMGAKWLAKVKKGQVAPKESVALSVVHLSPLGSQLSFSNAATRIENIIDWEMIANKYRALIGELNETNQSGGDNGEPANASGDSTAPAMTNQS